PIRKTTLHVGKKRDPPIEARPVRASNDGPFGYLFLATGPARYPRQNYLTDHSKPRTKVQRQVNERSLTDRAFHCLCQELGHFRGGTNGIDAGSAALWRPPLRG